MKTSVIQPGLYELFEGFENPCRDGRRTGWKWKRHFSGGERFVITADESISGRLEIFPRNGGRRHSSLTANPKKQGRFQKLLELLLEQLAPVVHLNVDDVLILEFEDAETVLNLLVEAEKISLDDVRSACKRHPV